MKVAVPLGSCDPADQIILEVSVAQKDAVWSSWLVIIGESWRMPLAVWTKALLLSSENYFPLERELVASFLASMQCELSTTSQQVTN